MMWFKKKYRDKSAAVDRLWYDGVPADAGAIARAFPNTPMIGGYVDGNYAWSSADWSLFPHADHILITAIPGSGASLDADVCDCETGDYTPGLAALWAREKRSRGYDRPTIYCNLSTAPSVRVATGTLLLGVDYDLWIADWTGSPHQIVFPDGRKAASTQFSSPRGGFYDESATYDSGWPHRKAPAPKGPYRHVVPPGNIHSLDWIAKSRNMANYDGIVTLSKANLNAENLAVFNAYLALDQTCKFAKIPDAGMPDGMVYYTENP